MMNKRTGAGTGPTRSRTVYGHALPSTPEAVTGLLACIALLAAVPDRAAARFLFDPLPAHVASLSNAGSDDDLAEAIPAQRDSRSSGKSRVSRRAATRSEVHERFAIIARALADADAPALAEARHRMIADTFDARMEAAVSAVNTTASPAHGGGDREFRPGLPMRVVSIREPSVSPVTRDRLALPRPRSSATASRIAPPEEIDLAGDSGGAHSVYLRELVEEVGTDPVAIFSWVYDTIEFTPTWGSIQGAESCARTRSCNAIDTSSLLIAMLRIAGIHARYQQGVIEVPIDRFRSWMGGFANDRASAAFAASAGIPDVTRIVDASGETVAVRLSHVWVRAWLDFVPSRGARHVSGDTWVFLDPSFKQSVRSDSRYELARGLPFDRMEYLAEPNDPAPVAYQIDALEAYLASTSPDVGLDRLLAPPSVVPYGLPILPAAAPYAVLSSMGPRADLADAWRGRMTISLRRPGASVDLLRHEITLSEAASRRLTIVYRPADESERAIAQSFSGMYLVPPYLLEVTPQIYLDGAMVAAAGRAMMGSELELTIRVELPGQGEREVHNRVRAGSLNAIFWAPAPLSSEMARAVGLEFARADERFGTLNIDNSDREPWVGAGLRAHGAAYFRELDDGTGSLAAAYGVARAITARLALLSADVEVDERFGVPIALRARGLSIDVDLLEEVQLRLDVEPRSDTTFERIRGLESSYWEHRVFADAARFVRELSPVSTVIALRTAREEGVPIDVVNEANVDSLAAEFDVGAAVIDEIRDAVARGNEVTVSRRRVDVDGWRGVGYIVEDPGTGSAAYRISGGLSGGVVAHEHEALVGGQPPPAVASRPSAIVAAGQLPCHLRKCTFRERFYSNLWGAVEEVGRQLFYAGYNTYVGEARADNIAWIGAVGGAHHPDDIFTFLGHGCNGQIFVPQSRETPDQYVAMGPSQLSPRRFRIAVMAGCATGGDCAHCDARTIQEGVVCTPNLSRQHAWRDALLNRQATGSPHTGRALVGQTTMVMTGVWRSAGRFWQHMRAGASASMASDALPRGAYVAGDEDAYIR